MDELLSVFGVYDFAIRDALVLCLVALAIYVLLSAGIFAVPQVGLMAIGAYTAAIASTDGGLPVPLAIVVGGSAAAAVGLVLATVLVRLDGIYLAIASIAFSEVVRVAVLNVPLTGGSQGKVGIAREVTDVWLLGAVVVAAAGLVLLKRSRFGLATSAMRVDGLMTRHQGVDTTRIRTLLFGLSGLLAGTAGALQVHLNGFVEPGQFDFELLTELIAVVVIGGMTSVAGTFVGAAVIFGLPFTLEGFAEYQVIVNGVIIVAVVAFAPHGIVGIVQRLALRRRTAGRVVPDEAAVPDEPVRAERADPATTHASTQPTLEAEHLTVTFGGVHALDDVGLAVRPGEVLGVVGPNGSGKTTLLNALSGAYRPSAGTGVLAGRALAPLWGKPHRLARCGVARTFQTIRLMDDESAARNVALGVAAGGRRERERTARELLARLSLGHVADLPVGELPYGLRRQVEIARALARQPAVLLLDEPTAGMSQSEREGVFGVVDGARAEGLAVVLVEHDVAMMRRHCDRLLVLDFGRLLADGPPEQVLGSKEVVDAYIGSGALA